MSWMQQDINTAFKTQTSQLCNRCGEYGRASLKIFLQTENGPKFLCNSVICVYCNGRKGQWETMYTGDCAVPDYALRGTRLPVGVTWQDVQRALMARPTCRMFTVDDFGQSKTGKIILTHGEIHDDENKYEEH